VNAFAVRIASLQQLEHRRFSSTLQPHLHPGVDAITSPIPIASHVWLTFSVVASNRQLQYCPQRVNDNTKYDTLI